MAFPGTYNISYYRGDTLEFRIYPKDSSGASFDLSGYTPLFTIADVAGSNGTQLEGYAEIDASNTSILCAIDPTVGNQLEGGTSYVYDVQINNDETTLPYNNVYTLLNGRITVTEQVTGAVSS